MTPTSASRPLLRTPPRVAVLAAALVLSGCGAVARQPLPTPFAPQPHYGQIVREIRLVGNEATDSAVIRGALVTRVGEPYTSADATRDYQRLLQLGVFTSIHFTTARVPGGITMTVHVAEVGRYRPTLSVDYIPENGWEVGPGFSSPNLLGRGHKTYAWYRFGNSQSAGVTLTQLWHPAARWSGCCWDLQYNWRSRYNVLDDFRERTHEVSLQYLANLSERFHLGPRLTYLNVASRPDSAGNVPAAMLGPDGRDEMPGLGLVMEYDSRNLRIYPTLGWYLAAVGERQGGWLGGPADYGRLTLDARRYTELAGPVHALALYSVASFTSGRMDGEVPVHQDFHLGGGNTVRGWEKGAREGKNQWITTVEYWWNLVPWSDVRLLFLRWSVGVQLAAFADVGTVWDDGDEFHRNWIGGGGLGLRLTLPRTGLLRMDLAVGSTSPSLDLGVYFGTGEKGEAQRRRVR